MDIRCHSCSKLLQVTKDWIELNEPGLKERVYKCNNVWCTIQLVAITIK